MSGALSLLPDVGHELKAMAERRSGLRLSPQVIAQLRGLQGTLDLLGDQVDIVLRDGLAHLGPVHELMQQASLQARELFAMVAETRP